MRILVIGASGFVGRHLAQGLLAEGYAVRCLARKPEKIKDLAAIGYEIVQGDILDAESMKRALDSVQAVYISVHTLSPQHSSTVGQGFMDIELQGLQNIVVACKANGVSRLIYLTSLGNTPGARSAWGRERWQAEQFLLGSGLEVTVIQPGQIVGVGGNGFNMMVNQAKRSPTLMIGSGKQKSRNIAVNDLVYYLIGVLSDSRTYGQAYEVGGDDVLTSDQMVDVTAEVLGHHHPVKIHVPRTLLGVFAPVIERVSKLPKGAIKGLVDGMADDLVGDPTPIRKLLPRPPLSYRQAVEQALTAEKS